MYVTQSLDTTKEAELYQIKLLRGMGFHGRWAKSCQLTRRVKSLCLTGIRAIESDPQLIKVKYSKALGLCSTTITGDVMSFSQDPNSIGQLLHSIFEQAEVPYFVTGGVAASTYGIPRATIDLDVVVQVSGTSLDRLFSALEDNGFYVPPVALEEVKGGAGDTITVIHQETADSADISIIKDEPFDQSRMSRRVKPEGINFYLCSAEDTVLQKLRWGRRTQSEKQWTDVLGILKMQQGALDYNYMRKWAPIIGVSTELENAISSSTT